jgi:hypothetical protein
MSDANHTMCREFEFVTNKKIQSKRVFSSKYSDENKHKSERLHAFMRYIVPLKGVDLLLTPYFFYLVCGME